MYPFLVRIFLEVEFQLASAFCLPPLGPSPVFSRFFWQRERLREFELLPAANFECSFVLQ